MSEVRTLIVDDSSVMRKIVERALRQAGLDPLVVHEAIMIEPTETESKEELDLFIDAMIAIAEQVKTDPSVFAAMPVTMPVTRLDETKAAKDMKFRV